MLSPTQLHVALRCRYALAVVGLLSTGARAYAPILWTGLPAKGLVLTPKGFTGNSRKLLPPQKLTIKSPFASMPHSLIPSFTFKLDRTIVWDDMGWCVEAAGNEDGDVIQVNQCTGETAQQWNWMPNGHGGNMIQLEGTSKCLDVMAKRGLDDDLIELRECGHKSTDSWKFGQSLPLPTRGASENTVPLSGLRHGIVFFASLAMAAFAGLGLSVWLVQRRLHARAMALSHHDLNWQFDHDGGVSLVAPLADRSDDKPLAWMPSSTPIRRSVVSMNAATSTKEPSATEADLKTVRSIGLAFALDNGTRKSHSMAENTSFVTGFFKGISTKAAFSQYVASFYFVYKAMEEAFDQTQDPQVKALDFPQLRRLPSLEQDMAYYFGDNWRNVKPSLATREYCDRITTIARESPELLVAHQYTRYLGDLFGGQMMGGMARSSLNLDEGCGTSFYDFKDIPNVRKFILTWYKKVNELDFTEKQKQDIVDEANLVFKLNIGILEDLESGTRATLLAIWRLAKNAVVTRFS